MCRVQETRWLEYMRTQLSSSHGDIGDSVSSVDKLISEHNKFMETAKVRLNLSMIGGWKGEGGGGGGGRRAKTKSKRSGKGAEEKEGVTGSPRGGKSCLYCLKSWPKCPPGMS